MPIFSHLVMSNRIIFEIVTIEVERAATLMALAKDLELQDYYAKIYYHIILACGWTEAEYNNEMLKRIDERWDDFNLKGSYSFIYWN